MSADTKLGTAELLFRRAKQLGLSPAWLAPDGVFAITHKGRERYVNFARCPLNSHTSTSLVRDKQLTRLILERNKLPSIPFTRPQSREEALGFLARHGKIIVKPLCGSGARDIHIVTSGTQLNSLPIADRILEQYVAGREMRYLVLNGQVIGVHHSDYGTSVAEDRPLRRISRPQSDWDPELIRLSLRIAHIFDLAFAAVDYLIDDTGRHVILEVNSCPGLKWFHAPTAGPSVDVASMFFETFLKDRHDRRSDTRAILNTPLRIME